MAAFEAFQPERVPGAREIRKLLVANRGEIACRIFRTCRELGIATVAVFSEADRHLPHVRQADEAVCIGGAAPSESYLDIPSILEAARRTGADAIHPGYGFLSENVAFAEHVQEAGLIWVGPPSVCIADMGDKVAARQVALAVGVPVVPGYGGEDSEEALVAAAREIGVPLMVKAAAGGGGRGMRRVTDLDALPEAIASARREAEGAFGSGRLLLELYVDQPRHIEIQILADAHGRVVHLGERECSVQRRHQKVLEEAPSPGVSAELRAQMGDAAVRLAQHVGYVGAGTVEMLLGADGGWYFLEMNTRLQVEHPVTEQVTGLDLVAWQLAVAEGHRLPAELQSGMLRGHSIEARLYAEDPFNDYLPGSGTLVRLDLPEGVRVDTGYGSGDAIGIHYDAMIAKIIATGPDRATANRRLSRALELAWAPGLITNLPLLRQVVDHAAWRAGALTTSFLQDHGLPQMPPANLERGALVAAVWSWKQQPHGEPSGWRMWGRREMVDTWTYLDQSVEVGVTESRDGLVVRVGETLHQVREVHVEGDQMTLEVDGHRWNPRVAHAGAPADGVPIYVHLGQAEAMVTRQARLPAPKGAVDEPGTCVAPTPGVVRAVHVTVGETVEAGALLVTLEAMKMEHALRAPLGGLVEAVRVEVGEAVEQGALLVKLETPEDAA